MRNRILPMIAALIVSGQAYAQQDTSLRRLALMERVLNNVHHEMITCAAYFSAVSACMGNANDKNGEASYAAASGKMISMAAEIGSSLGLTDDAQGARAKIEADKIRSALHGNCMNISAIIVRHMDRCTTVAENPDAIIQEYEAKFSSAK
jgi:hypothetical protein